MIGLTAVIILIKYATKKGKKEKKEVLYKEIATAFCVLYMFSKAEIEKALNYTTEREFLGRGSAGQVYKGMLPSGQLVAMKQFIQSNTSDSFTREIETFQELGIRILFVLSAAALQMENNI
ncbi:hypothetical protein Pfo_027062 [Paulownia fortunei]|nr:hypothetical protein Pfo_027062 [Paulownia fortunei]